VSEYISFWLAKAAAEIAVTASVIAVILLVAGIYGAIKRFRNWRCKRQSTGKSRPRQK